MHLFGICFSARSFDDRAEKREFLSFFSKASKEIIIHSKVKQNNKIRKKMNNPEWSS